jgi:hypothetical protein
MVFEVLAKVVLSAEEIGICEVEERKILREIVLPVFVSKSIETRWRGNPTCIGVPVRMTRRLTSSLFKAWKVWESA